MKKMFGDGGRRGKWLLALGLLLLAYSLISLYRIDQLAQYIAPAAPEAADAGEDEREPGMLAQQVAVWEETKGELGEGVKAGMAAVAYGRYVTNDGSRSETATVVCVEPGWFDTHPRFLTAGYLFSETDNKNGAHKAVLDEELAFRLFPTSEPCGLRIQLDGIWYEVIGVVRRADSPGDTDDYRVYIPLNTAAAEYMQTDYVQIDCLTGLDGEKRALESVAANVLGPGSYYDTEKEVMRASMIARIMLVLFGIYLLLMLLRGWNRRTVRLVEGWFEEVKRRYFKRMLPGVAALSLVQIAGYCAIALAGWAVLTLMIEPMYVFTEWIPEVFVEWSSITGRIEELMRSSAEITRHQTREYASIRFYGALTRWGVVCVLAGMALYKVWPAPKAGRPKTSEE